MFSPDLTLALVMAVPMIISITLHEAAHGFVANRLGDPTAMQAGRVSFNPLKHVDLVGTIILPLVLLLSGLQFLFGYAKPVPVDFARLKDKRFGELKVAFAGPAMNIALALLGALLLRLDFLLAVPQDWKGMFDAIHLFIIFNLLLAVFNLLPILPLDGGRILHCILPPEAATRFAKTEKVGLLTVFLLFLIPSLFQSLGFSDFSSAYYLLQQPVAWLYELIMQLMGIHSGCLTPRLCYAGEP